MAGRRTSRCSSATRSSWSSRSTAACATASRSRPTLSEDELVERAKESPRVQAHLDGKQVRQTIVVPGKLVNLVVR